MAGYAITKATLDNQMGALVLNLKNALAAIVEFNTLLNDSTVLPTATMTAAPISYSSADDTQIRAAFADLKKLSDIANGTATQASVNDFWFNAKHLTGSITR